MPEAIRGAAAPASGSSAAVRDIPPIEPRSARNAIWLAALVALSVAVVYLTPLRSDGSESRCHAEIWFVADGDDVFVCTPGDSWRAQAR